jgi:predicted Holliday junction resolvase-like endonuclease
MKDKTLQAILYKLEKEIQSLKNEISTKNETLNLTQNMIEKLKEYRSYAEYKEKYNEISKQYEIEKERLLKLHHIFKEREDECAKLREEVNGWKEWYNYNKKSFDQLFAIASPRSLKKAPAEPVTSKKRKKIKRKETK